MHNNAGLIPTKSPQWFLRGIPLELELVMTPYYSKTQQDWSSSSNNLCYNEHMKPLIETNPNLINKGHREFSNARSAKTSCGVEGIKVNYSSKMHIQVDSTKTSDVFNKIKNRLDRN